MVEFYQVREGMHQWVRDILGDHILITENRDSYVRRPSTKEDDAQWGLISFYLSNVQQASLGYNDGNCMVMNRCVVSLDLYIRNNAPLKNLDINVQRVLDAWKGDPKARPEVLQSVLCRDVRITSINDQQIWTGMNLSMVCEYDNRG